MKLLKIFLILIVSFLITDTCYSQEPYVVVALAKIRNNCGEGTYLGYAYSYGAYKNEADIKDKAKEMVIRSNPAYKNITREKKIETVDNYSWSKCKGTYMVIITATTRDKDDQCDEIAFGVGFGANRNIAESEAIENLEVNNWDWEKEQGYSVVEHKAF